MATIKPFRALRPNGQVAGPLDFLLGETQGKDVPGELQSRLEPRDGDGDRHERARQFLSGLRSGGHYLREESPCIYVHERMTAGGPVTGVFALTSIGDLERGEILMHEDTLGPVERELASYREQVGLEGSAVLLAHEPSAEISGLVFRALNLRDGFCQVHGDELHRFARVSDPAQVREFQRAFARLHHVHLADGHHRCRAAQRAGNGWVLSKYVSTGDLTLSPIHRMVRPGDPGQLDHALDRIGEYFYLSHIPANMAYRPLQRNRMGMFARGKWYQLDLRPELGMDNPIDAVLLQDMVLSGLFGIADPSGDDRLCCFHDMQWRELLVALSQDPGAIAFTLCGMAVKEFLQVSLTGQRLPPKSTSIGPKPVYGMLMNLLDGFGEDWD